MDIQDGRAGGTVQTPRLMSGTIVAVEPATGRVTLRKWETGLPQTFQARQLYPVSWALDWAAWPGPHGGRPPRA
jgi:hypothetical protein